MSDLPFVTEIAYSVQNEDYQTELAVLERVYAGRPLRVLMVASSGENALSILTQPNVASVAALDLNPALIHLCELRRAALEHLSRDDQLRLLGAHPAHLRTEDAAARLALFDSISAHLPEHSRAYWLARRDADVAFGLQHVGRNDQLMSEFCARLRAAGFAPLQRSLHEQDLPAWCAVHEQVATAEHGQFDLISLSNIPDWMSAEQFAQVAMQARACLRDGGALLARTASGNTAVGEAMARHLLVDAEFDAALARIERGPWFRTISAGLKR